jgi:hypothetical protein
VIVVMGRAVVGMALVAVASCDDFPPQHASPATAATNERPHPRTRTYCPIGSVMASEQIGSYSAA